MMIRFYILSKMLIQKQQYSLYDQLLEALMYIHFIVLILICFQLIILVIIIVQYIAALQ